MTLTPLGCTLAGREILRLDSKIATSWRKIIFQGWILRPHASSWDCFYEEASLSGQQEKQRRGFQGEFFSRLAPFVMLAELGVGGSRHPCSVRRIGAQAGPPKKRQEK